MNDENLSLIPARAGVEKTEIIGAGDDGIGCDITGVLFVAFAGTGFDEDNPQHRFGSDGL